MCRRLSSSASTGSAGRTDRYDGRLGVGRDDLDEAGLVEPVDDPCGRVATGIELGGEVGDGAGSGEGGDDLPVLAEDRDLRGVAGSVQAGLTGTEVVDLVGPLVGLMKADPLADLADDRADGEGAERPSQCTVSGSKSNSRCRC